LSTSSSSLYSFLKTSEDYSGTNDSQNSSGEDILRKKEKRQLAKPVLCDPFWLENVTMTRELVMTYQLEETRDLEAILAADRERLKSMVQPPLVHAQLVELFSLIGGGDGSGGDDGVDSDCIELAKLELEKESASSSYEDSAISGSVVDPFLFFNPKESGHFC
jgi:Period protein 2/3C-terminal region